jgi:hypothetical protein
VQWLPQALSLEVKWLGCEADPSPPSTAKVKIVWGMPSLPVCLYGVVLN